MAEATLTLIADGLADAMNAYAFDPQCEAVREWSAETPLADLDRIQLLVVPVTWTMNRISRQSWEEFYRLNVGLRQRHAGPSGALAPKDRLDPLAALADQIVKFTRDTRIELITIAAYATVQEIKPIVAMAREDLAKLRVFTSVFEVNYRLSL